jgi:hypothetical protein
MLPSRALILTFLTVTAVLYRALFHPGRLKAIHWRYRWDVTGVVGFIGLVIAFLQMAVALAWIDPKYEPWPQIVKICCCGSIQVENIKTRKTKEEEARRQKDAERDAAHTQVYSVGMALAWG